MDKSSDRHTERRQQSIERLERAALEILRRKSYGDIRIEDITSRAGMAKGSLYMYFKGKDELYHRIVKKYFIDRLNMVGRQLLEVEDSRQAVLGLIDFIFDPGEESEYLEFFYRSAMDKQLLELVREDMEQYARGFMDIISGHLERIGLENPRERTMILMAALDALFMYRYLGLFSRPYWESGPEQDKLRRELIRMIGIEG